MRYFLAILMLGSGLVWAAERHDANSIAECMNMPPGLALTNSMMVFGRVRAVSAEGEIPVALQTGSGDALGWKVLLEWGPEGPRAYDTYNPDFLRQRTFDQRPIWDTEIARLRYCGVAFAGRWDGLVPWMLPTVGVAWSDDDQVSSDGHDEPLPFPGLLRD